MHNAITESTFLLARRDLFHYHDLTGGSFIGLNSIVLYIHRLKLVFFTVLIFFIYCFPVATAIFIITLQCFLEIYIKEIFIF